MLIQRVKRMSANRNIKSLFKQKGGPALRNIRKMLVETYEDDSYVSQALRYLSEVTLQGALPVFPALLAMANEAVRGNGKETTPFGEAILLVSFAADLHDDVIDQSFTKGSKQTILGKFNMPTAILTGDILLVEGLKKLTEAAESLPKEKFREIIRWTSDAVFEISSAEALQLRLKSKVDLTPEEYYEVIRLKAVVPELCMKIGAALATNDDRVIKSIGAFGRLYGVNSTIGEEFADLLTTEELKNRLGKECPPLPMLYALKNTKTKAILQNMLTADLTKQRADKVADVVLNSTEIDALQKILHANAISAQQLLPEIVEEKIKEELQNLIFAPLKFFEP